MLMDKEPEMTDSSPHMMNAQDVYDNEQLGRIESTLDVPKKSNSDEAMEEMSETDAMTVGELTDEAKRMTRLRSFIDTLDL
jgi:transcriptional regulator of NAD metabolism